MHWSRIVLCLVCLALLAHPSQGLMAPQGGGGVVGTGPHGRVLPPGGMGSDNPPPGSVSGAGHGTVLL
jgi:hypothetical protein